MCCVSYKQLFSDSILQPLAVFARNAMANGSWSISSLLQLNMYDTALSATRM